MISLLFFQLVELVFGQSRKPVNACTSCLKLIPDVRATTLSYLAELANLLRNLCSTAGRRNHCGMGVVFFQTHISTLALIRAALRAGKDFIVFKRVQEAYWCIIFPQRCNKLQKPVDALLPRIVSEIPRYLNVSFWERFKFIASFLQLKQRAFSRL